MAFFTLLFSESSLDEVNVLIFGRKSKSFENMVNLWIKSSLQYLTKARNESRNSKHANTSARPTTPVT